MNGIDVSKHQGEIGWQKVKAAGVEFAIIRAGYGMYGNQTDPQFAANMAGARAAGIPVGVYWYSYAVTPDEARREAAVCLQTIEPYRAQVVLPVFFDQEYEPSIKALSKQARTDICIAFMGEIRKAGYRAGLYCSLDWYRNWVDSAKLSAYPVWIAQYAAQCGYSGDNLICWQHSSTGRVDGISGNVDMDIGYAGLLQPDGKTGWVQASAGWYWYEDGEPVKSRWVKDGGYWYYLGEDGRMATGLIEVDGKGYYLNQERKTVGGVYLPVGACIVTDGSGKIV